MFKRYKVDPINKPEVKDIENGTYKFINHIHLNPGYNSNDSIALKQKEFYEKNDNMLPKDEKNEKSDENQSGQTKDPNLWRDLLAFWLLGLCNNYGYKVMLSAAHDIIGKFDDHNYENDGDNLDNSRQCHIMSTGAILLADIIPSLVVKLTAPFVPFWVNIRIIIAILLTVAGFSLVGFAKYQWMALFGVVCISASAGLGETTFLGYSSRFNRNVVSTWSSGTGGAGLIGSLSYASLRSAGVSSLVTMLIMLVVPALECFAFWILLRKPIEPPASNDNLNDNNYNIKEKLEEKQSNDHENPLETMKEKLFYILYLFKYMIPLTIVYFAEYFINQGLFELIYFENSSLDKNSQYRWLNVDYQIGVLISRSTVNLFSVEKIWLFPFLQLINLIYFLNEVIFYITPTIWIVFTIVLWEGLLGGGAYVNTFFKMSRDIPPARKQFALSVVAIADSVGITLAGFLSLPAHNSICNIPVPDRMYEL